ncbi:MAG TPA: DCC1-like thiol-disulfide oxidoreductase family protein [Polyangiaceae bacterium]|nr:DCC1-like thiol-disulfide oxidoreductase family protein [Polyangiaceae bacterium]
MDTTAWLDEVEALALERLHAPARPKTLTVLFDPGCPLCRRCRDWMLTQPAYLPIQVIACTSERARREFREIPWLGDALVVVSDTRDVWAGPAAFLTCLWALEDWREWSYSLAGPAFAPLAERFFQTISAHKLSLSRFFAHRCDAGTCGARHA